ncbi:MAG: TonB-dependent receptor [Ottowia sp.]
MGTPNDGAWVTDTRATPVAYNRFESRSIGAYVQDTVSLTDTVKLVGGLRFDHFKGSYRNADGSLGNAAHRQPVEPARGPALSSPTRPRPTTSPTAPRSTPRATPTSTACWSTRPPAASAKTPPEKSRNIEIGGKWDLLDKRMLAGVALFYSQKYNERNTDPDTAAAAGVAVRQAARRRHGVQPGRPHHAGLGNVLEPHLDPQGQDRPQQRRR